MASRSCIDLKWNKSGVVSLKRGNGWTTQSLAYKDSNTRYVICNNTSNEKDQNNIELVHKNGYVTISNTFSAGHANGSCYCHENGYIYVLPAAHGASSEVRVYDPKNNYRHKFTVKLRTSKGNAVTIAGLAYDRITKQFYGASSNKICVFPYESMSKGGTCKQVKMFNKKFTPGSGYYQQDCGGHNGVIMCCHSKQHKRNVGIYGYIDCYRASDGKYLKSYRTYGEVESVAVEGSGASGRLHVLWAQDRELIRTNTIFNLTGAPAKFSSIATKTVSEKAIRNKVVKKAKSYVGNKGGHFWKYSGMQADWCVMFAKCVFNECGLSDIVPTKGSWVVSTWADEMRKKGIQEVSAKNAKPGDIVMYSSTKYTYAHVEIVTEAGCAKSCGGNTGTGDYLTTTVKNRYHGGKVKTVFRPPFTKSKSAGNITGDVDNAVEEVQATFEAHPEQLVSSENYGYIMAEDSDAKESAAKERSAMFTSLTYNMNSNVILDSPANIRIVTTGMTLTSTSRPQTKVEGEIFGSQFPVALNPVEAPFAELTIGGYTFGVGSADGYPNYINGLSVVRTNGSMNEYTINLIHQVAPGSNPNFIDELLAKNSYNKITIEYGDANSNVVFIDSSALLTGASVKFDFASSQIQYTVKATSSVISTATHKLNYASRTDKPSNVIRELINNNATGLADAFPRMRDVNFVNQNNLIPTNDAVVTLEGISNVNPLNYLKQLVASMSSTTSNTSTYYLVLQGDYFKIYEIDSLSAAYDAAVYEVTLNYPDDNQVFSFNCDTDFSWPLAYNYSGEVTEYNYNMESNSTKSYKSSSQLLDFASSQQRAINDNWWKQVTEFPTKATLECRGLLSPTLLMTYVKINALYYGQQRLTGGVYIVTGQEDTLTGAGYRTKLSLLRVAGPQQHLTIDGRIRT